MVIYKITNRLDGKVYIGQTIQKVEERFWQHCHRCPSQPHRSYIHNAIQKDGKDNFTVEVIASTDSLDALNILEEHYIRTLNTLAPRGYNLHPGGCGKICHPETKAKISAAMKRKPKDALFGGKRMVGAPKGRPVSAERRARIAATLTGRPNVSLYKQVQCVETGAVYESVNACAIALSANRVTISGLIKSGKRSREGRSFRFLK